MVLFPLILQKWIRRLTLLDKVDTLRVEYVHCVFSPVLVSLCTVVGFFLCYL